MKKNKIPTEQYQQGYPQMYSGGNPQMYGGVNQPIPNAQGIVRKRLNPLSVIIAIIGVLCIAAVLLLPTFLKKSAADTEMYSFFVQITNDRARVDYYRPTMQYSISYENEDEWLNLMKELVAEDLPNGTGELNSEVFVVPPMKIVIDDEAAKIFNSYPYIVDDGFARVYLNHAVETTETFYDESAYGADRFCLLILKDGDYFDVEHPGGVISSIIPFNGNESYPFAVVDMDKVFQQMGVDPAEVM